MVVPRIALHEYRHGHVAGATIGARAPARVMGVLGAVVPTLVTCATERVARLTRAVAVRIVTVPAAHAFLEHLALLKRDQLVELLLH
jgi:hypothetical protein